MWNQSVVCLPVACRYVAAETHLRTLLIFRCEYAKATGPAHVVVAQSF